MKLDAIRELLRTSGPDEWHTIASFPTYHDWVAPLTDDRPIATHEYVATYRDDVRLTLAWGMEPPGDGNPHPPGSAWTEWVNFADPSVHSFLLDVFYCGSLVDRHTGARVDGGRALLPYPKPHGMADVADYIGAAENRPPIAWTAPRTEVEVFRLIHELGGPRSDYDQCIEQSGIVVDESA